MFQFIKDIKHQQNLSLKEKLLIQIEVERKRFEENYPTPPKDNPHTKSLNAKLTELLDLRNNTKDTFVNWITGINSATILFIASKTMENKFGLDLNTHIVKALIEVAFLMFVSFISAIFFKISNQLRFKPLELEVEILSILYHSHELKKDIRSYLKNNIQLDLETELSFLKNHLRELQLLNPVHIKKIERTIHLKDLVTNLLYRLTVSFFVLGVIKIFGIVFL